MGINEDSVGNVIPRIDVWVRQEHGALKEQSVFSIPSLNEEIEGYHAVSSGIRYFNKAS